MADDIKTEVRLPDPSKLLVSSSPHAHGGDSVRRIMLLVVLALLPSCAMGVYYFGLDALRVLLACVISCVALEWACGRLMGNHDDWKDGSALITGLLLGMCLSSTTPWWVCSIGAVLAIIFAKQLYGGLGYNPFNPALVARIGLMIAFPKLMTTWAPTRTMAAEHSSFIPPESLSTLASHPVTFVHSVVDGVTCATPLTEIRHGGADLLSWPRLWDYAIGNVGGCIGETSAVALALGGLFLICIKVIKWQTPAAYIGTVAVISAIAQLCTGKPVLSGTLFQILTGGLVLGAFFMATDYVTSPISKMGKIVSGIGCGVITCVIRNWGSYPEGVMFSIVLMNSLAPLIDRFTARLPFGHQKPVKEATAK